MEISSTKLKLILPPGEYDPATKQLIGFVLHLVEASINNPTAALNLISLLSTGKLFGELLIKNEAKTPMEGIAQLLQHMTDHYVTVLGVSNLDLSDSILDDILRKK